MNNSINKGSCKEKDTSNVTIQLNEAIKLLRESLATIDSLPGYPRGADTADRIEAFLKINCTNVEINEHAK